MKIKLVYSLCLLVLLSQCNSPFKKKSSGIVLLTLVPENSFTSSNKMFLKQAWDVFSSSGDYLYRAGLNGYDVYSITKTLIKCHVIQLDTSLAIAGLNKDCQYEIYLVRDVDGEGLVSICMPKVFEKEEQHWIIDNSEPIQVIFYNEALDELKRYHITGYDQDEVEDLIENGSYPKRFCDAYYDNNDTMKFSWNANTKCQITANSFKLYESETENNGKNDFPFIKTLYPGQDLLQHDNDSLFAGSVGGAFGPRLYIFNDSLNRLYTDNLELHTENHWYIIDHYMDSDGWVCPFKGGFYLVNSMECRKFILDK